MLRDLSQRRHLVHLCTTICEQKTARAFSGGRMLREVFIAFLNLRFVLDLRSPSHEPLPYLIHVPLRMGLLCASCYTCAV